MQLRKLGRTDLEISPLSLGSNMFGGILDESTSIAILDAYVEAGGNCIDTADRYPGWISERKPGETEMILSLPQSVRAQFIQKQYMNDRGFALLAEIERIASRYHATPTQISLAWIMARPGVTAPIASATSVQQVHELLGAIELKLDEDTIIALNTASQWRIV